MTRLLAATALTVLVLLVLATGCLFQDDEATPTPVSSPTVTLSPTPLPMSTATPGPTTTSKVFNIAGSVSGLDITLTASSWTGDEVEVGWNIRNSSGGVFDKERLYSVFYPGAVATDQNGAEGEYFVPMRMENDLARGDTLHYETKWLFLPDSEVITVRLVDIFQEGSHYVDLDEEYVFWR